MMQDHQRNARKANGERDIFHANCQRCGINLYSSEEAKSRQGNGELCSAAIRNTGSDGYCCARCWQYDNGKQYMPTHPKADADGYVSVRDFIGFDLTDEDIARRARNVIMKGEVNEQRRQQENEDF